MILAPNFKILSKDWLESLGVVQVGHTNIDQTLSYEGFAQWVEEGHADPLSYLSDHRKEMRKSIRSFFPEFKSALVFAFDYRTIKRAMAELPSATRIAAYAFAYEGEDYHNVLKYRLEIIAHELQKNFPFNYKISLDMHPVLERDLAYRAGLGWFGKNSMLISPHHGSYFLLGSLLLDQELEGLENPSLETDHCGHCRLCLDACPTDALLENERKLIANRCLATFTIESFKNISPPQGFENSRGEIFGCDICQDVCPWNKKSLTEVFPHRWSEKGQFWIEFWIRKSFSDIFQNIQKLSLKEFKKFFAGSIFLRTGKTGLLKNLIPWTQKDES